MEEIILINTDSEHNKFYIFQADNLILKKNWGRIGANGQSKTETFHSNSYCTTIMKSAAAKKINEGYNHTSRENLNILIKRSKLVGLGNKVDDVKLCYYDKEFIYYIDENDLHKEMDKEVGILTKIHTHKGPISILATNNNKFIVDHKDINTKKSVIYAISEVKTNDLTIKKFIENLDEILLTTFGK